MKGSLMLIVLYTKNTKYIFLVSAFFTEEDESRRSIVDFLCILLL